MTGQKKEKTSAKKKTETLPEKVSEMLIKITPETVKEYLCPKATNQEVVLFLNQCQAFGLNPFKREIYLIKYGDSPAQFVVGYETYLKRAERSKQWSGMESGVKGDIAKNNLVAWVKIYRKDWEKPLYHEVEYEEYVKLKKDETPTRFWKDKPKTMLKKVAISQAFRMAFPDEMAGMPYIVEEIGEVEEQRMPNALKDFTDETEESKEKEAEADKKAAERKEEFADEKEAKSASEDVPDEEEEEEKPAITHDQIQKICRIESTLVDKFKMDPGKIIEKFQGIFGGVKREEITQEGAVEWLKILEDRLEREMQKVYEAEQKKKTEEEKK